MKTEIETDTSFEMPAVEPDGKFVPTLNNMGYMTLQIMQNVA